jgi:alpha-tubulin suppressor-like RCC1 family protein
VLGLDTGVSQVVARSNYSCAIKNGGVWCWGGNADGRLGNGSYDDSAEPTPVIGLREGVAEVSLGPSHACALLLNQSVRCWGSGGSGELGSVSPTSSSVPLQAVRFPARAEALALGASTTCGIADGAAFCLGWNGYGQLGNSAVPTVPTPIPVIQNDPVFQDGFDLR